MTWATGRFSVSSVYPRTSENSTGAEKGVIVPEPTASVDGEPSPECSLLSG